MIAPRSEGSPEVWSQTSGETPNLSYVPSTWTSTTTAPQWLCPDLLSIRQIGAADGWRGRVVRGFFIALKKITGV